jgi:hypothetical protein
MNDDDIHRASGKTLVVTTTHGNVVTECIVDGKPLVIKIMLILRSEVIRQLSWRY